MVQRDASWDLVVVGGVYTDCVVQGENIPSQGETVVGNTFLMLPGSKASNQAVEAARLGARVALVARVGKDSRGDDIVASLQDEGVDTRYIVRDGASATGISLIQVNMQGNKQMMVALGASQHLTIEDVERAREAMAQAKIVATQLEVPQDVALTALRLGRELGAQTLFDPAPAAKVSDELLQLVDILKPDAKEAYTLTGITVHDRDSARAAAQRLLQRGVRIVSIQAGKEGDLLVWQDGEEWLPRFPVQSVDSTGAGDTLAGALATALAMGQSLQDAGRFASAAAALTTTKLGARPALPYRDEVLHLLQKRS